jgi:hypothetical protein
MSIKVSDLILQATSGYSGFSGMSGFVPGGSGYSGISGYSGQSGQSGFVPGGSGYSGYSGFSGHSGPGGSSGYSGYSGQVNTGQVARVTCSTTQVITSIDVTTPTIVNVDTPTINPYTIIDTVNHKITPTQAGYYQVDGCIACNPPDTTGEVFIQAFIVKNDSTYSPGQAFDVNGAEQGITSYISLLAADIIYCNGTTDYLQ